MYLLDVVDYEYILNEYVAGSSLGGVKIEISSFRIVAKTNMADATHLPRGRKQGSKCHPPPPKSV